MAIHVCPVRATRIVQTRLPCSGILALFRRCLVQASLPRSAGILAFFRHRFHCFVQASPCAGAFDIALFRHRPVRAHSRLPCAGNGVCLGQAVALCLCKFFPAAHLVIAKVPCGATNSAPSSLPSEHNLQSRESGTNAVP